MFKYIKYNLHISSHRDFFIKSKHQVYFSMLFVPKMGSLFFCPLKFIQLLLADHLLCAKRNVVQ